MNMRFAISATASAALLFMGCSQTVTPEEKIERLENQRSVLTREFLADLHRQKAECEAQAIEFSGDPLQARTVEGCLETLRFMAKTSRGAIERIDKQIAEIRNEQLKDNQFNRFEAKPNPFDQFDNRP